MFKQGDFVIDKDGDVALVVSATKLRVETRWVMIHGRHIGEGVTTLRNTKEFAEKIFTPLDNAVFEIMKGVNHV